ncbi:hypothetical protein [Hungatella sp.]|uniref:hypothetical protein n=1 Tax=Hungatella sp. TaxID=2613924 RepID=UPI002A8051E2|nr:hypothetical protein [Hungatella sp.]
MTVEQIELRKILSQMLADNGINRETLKEMVNEILDEKVEKAVSQVLKEGNIKGIVDGKIDNISRRVIQREIENKVRRVLDCTSLSINCREPEPGVFGLYMRWCERTGNQFTAESYQEFLDQKDIDDNVI